MFQNVCYSISIFIICNYIHLPVYLSIKTPLSYKLHFEIKNNLKFSFLKLLISLVGRYKKGKIILFVDYLHSYTRNFFLLYAHSRVVYTPTFKKTHFAFKIAFYPLRSFPCVLPDYYIWKICFYKNPVNTTFLFGCFS